MPGKHMNCPSCGTSRLVSGQATAASLCRACFDKLPASAKLGKRAKRGPPISLDQWGTEHAADKAKRNPPTSWWAVPDAQFAANLAQQLPRLHAIGASVPKTQRGLGDL